MRQVIAQLDICGETIGKPSTLVGVDHEFDSTTGNRLQFDRPGRYFMLSKAMTTFIRRRCRTIVATAMVPLVFLSGWPVSAGCICADGHREPVCCAAKRGAERACCAERVASIQKKCCSRSAEHSSDCSNGCPSADGRRCTPIVHEAIPAVGNPSPAIDGLQPTAADVSVVAMPATFIDAIHVDGVFRDTGSPTSDLVIAFHRLVI
jgi:hypothetical protein